jgi:ribosomal protein S18 acetylase RimI-like enzyme
LRNKSRYLSKKVGVKELNGSSSSEIQGIIEASLLEYQVSVARALPGGKWRNEDGITWVSTGVPFAFYNGVFKTSIDPTQANARIHDMTEEFRRLNLPITWQLGPSSQPVDMPQRLLTHGFFHDEDEPGMAIDLLSVREEDSMPADLEIRCVRSKADMDRWVETWASGAPPSFIHVGLQIHGRLTLEDQSPWQYFVGMLQGEPVATVLLFLGSQAAVVHWVVTLPQVRGKGIGTAMTLAAVKEARRRGYQTAVLTASDLGVGIYRKLGFTEYCTISKYVMKPGDTAL